MIKLVSRAVVLLVMCAVIGVTASAKTISKKVTFKRDVTVNGTLVKAGTYEAVFDDQAGELSIIKGKKTVAKAPARIEKFKNLDEGSYSYRNDGGGSVLMSVAFKDGNLAVIGNGGEGAGERSQ
jgi:hypothetical protein